MQAVPVSFGRKAAEAASLAAGTELLVNCFLEVDPGQSVAPVYGGPGLVEFTALLDGPLRGGAVLDGVPFVIAGQKLYSLAETGAFTEVGLIAGVAPVVCAVGVGEMMIVADALTYSYSPGDELPLKAVDHDEFLNAYSVDWLAQTFVFGTATRSSFFVSELNDGRTYDATQAAIPESKPDELLRVIVDNNELLLMGASTVEGWYYSGESDFPFARSSTFIDSGLIGRDAVARIDGTTAWLADDLTVRAIRGGAPQRLSSHAIESAIGKWSMPQTARAFTWRETGHAFWALRHDDGCVVFDFSTGVWSIRRSLTGATWRVVGTLEAYGKSLALDGLIGTVWSIDRNAHTEGNEPMLRQSVSDVLQLGRSRFRCAELELFFDTGSTLSVDDDPEVFVEVSRDRGSTFEGRRLRALGARGERKKRVRVHRLGNFGPEGAVFRVSMTDDAPYVLLDAVAMIEQDRR